MVRIHPTSHLSTPHLLTIQPTSMWLSDMTSLSALSLLLVLSLLFVKWGVLFVPIMCSSLVVPIMCSSLVADQSVVIVCLIVHSSSCLLVFFICFHKLLSIYNLNKGYGPVTLLRSLRCLEYLLFSHLRSANLWWFVAVDSRVYRRCSSLCRSWEDCWFFTLLVIIWVAVEKTVGSLH